MPVSIQPRKLWALSLYKTTLTKQCLLDNGNEDGNTSCILQLLTHQHTPLVSILGKQSGRDINKKEECANVGFPWHAVRMETEGRFNSNTHSIIDVLPDCALYLQLQILKGNIVDAGDHVVVIGCVEKVGKWDANRVKWLVDDTTDVSSTLLKPLDRSEEFGSVLYTGYLRRHGYL